MLHSPHRKVGSLEMMVVVGRDMESLSRPGKKDMGMSENGVYSQ